jgi:hypothetical protein
MLEKTASKIVHYSLLIITLMIAGCGGKHEPGSNASQPAQVVPSAPTQANPGPSVSTTPAASVPAIATAEGETSGVRAEVQQLKRGSDNTLTLKFAIVNDSDKKVEFGYNFGDKDNEIKDYNSIGGVTLVDGLNKKKYFVARDTENNCVCSRSLNTVEPKSRANLWAKFPAPPDDVQKISIIIPHFGPLDDVTISR